MGFIFDPSDNKSKTHNHIGQIIFFDTCISEFGSKLNHLAVYRLESYLSVTYQNYQIDGYKKVKPTV